MTRKHFTAIAVMLNAKLQFAETKAEAELIASIARNLAATFSQINGRFDFAQFYRAVGLSPSGYLPEVTAEDVAAAIAAIKNVASR